MKRRILPFFAMGWMLLDLVATAAEADMGFRMVDVPAGEFRMGTPGEPGRRDLCFNEVPEHTVHLTYAFRMSDQEVTIAQFRRFRADYKGVKACEPYATGVSWYEAAAFCEWLSKKEKRPYRLPTEAEWECAARQADRLGLKNMLSGPLEWCSDWFSDYSDVAQTDPVGPDNGFARVVRGGCLAEPSKADGPLIRYTSEQYAHASHRAAMGPAFAAYPGGPSGLGEHHIGFRVVQAQLPVTRPWPADPSSVCQGVKDTASMARQSPSMAKPYLRKRHLLPDLQGTVLDGALGEAGASPSFRGQTYSPALAACPNGDLLMVAVTASCLEYEPESALIATRLRFGAEEWEMPAPFLDFATVNDHAPLLFVEKSVIRLFWGSPMLPGGYPFQWIESTDNGASWSSPKFPQFKKAPGDHARQPVNSAFRGLDGTLYVASDGASQGRVQESLLWASDDDGGTWRDTGGRTAGGHTAFCMLRDGNLVGMGGKNSDIEGFMPGVLSRDGGKTWKIFKTVFSSQDETQRPSVLRLKSGNLLFAGDFQDIHGNKPQGESRAGAFVALSEDEGKNWHLKMVHGAQPHTNPKAHKGASTLGCSAVCQAPNGMIHLVTSFNRPWLHFEFNEAWIVSQEKEVPGDETLMKSAAAEMSSVMKQQDTMPNGKLRVTWSGGEASDGRFLLHGKETRYYPDGQKQYEATYALGRKVGTETYWCADGGMVWQWQHQNTGVSTWTHYWRNGRKKSESHWRGHCAERVATCWNQDGSLVAPAPSVVPEDKGKQESAHEAMTSRCASHAEPGAAKKGAACYSDRPYAITVLPPELEGGDLVRTLNADDYSSREDYLVLEHATDTLVYVCYWGGAARLPEWLKQGGWTKLSGQACVKIGEKEYPYTVLFRTASKGRLALGGNERKTTAAMNMYFVVTKRLEQES